MSEENKNLLTKRNLLIASILGFSIGAFFTPGIGNASTDAHTNQAPNTAEVLRQFNNAESSLTAEDVGHKTGTTTAKASNKLEQMESTSYITCHVEEAFVPKKCSLTSKGEKQAEKEVKEYQWRQRTQPLREHSVDFGSFEVRDNQSRQNGSVHVVSGELDWGAELSQEFYDVASDREFQDDYEEGEITGRFTVNVTDRFTSNFSVQDTQFFEIGKPYRESDLELLRECGETDLRKRIIRDDGDAEVVEVRRGCEVEILLDRSKCLPRFELFEEAEIVLSEAGGFCVR